jgi:GNAT superfamily N-acetyltransferase
MEVRQVDYKTLHTDPHFGVLAEEYKRSSTHILPDPSGQESMYLQMEQSGVLTIMAAYEEDRLIGFLSMLVSVLPHYGVQVGATESYFVAEKYRTTGAGLRLLKHAEKAAEAQGATAMLVSAPIGSRLDTVLSNKTSYEPVNTIYVRTL